MTHLIHFFFSLTVSVMVQHFSFFRTLRTFTKRFQKSNSQCSNSFRISWGEQNLKFLCKFCASFGKFWDRLGGYFFVVKPKSMTAAFQLPLGTHRIRSPRHHAFYRTARLFPFFSEKTAEKHDVSALILWFWILKNNDNSIRFILQVVCIRKPTSYQKIKSDNREP